MARLSVAAAGAAWKESGDQFAAIARLRWCAFLNSMRTLRGRLELVSWVLMGAGFAALGLGGMVGFGVAAWYFVSHAKTEWLAALFWGIFLYWQLFPVMSTAFAESFDSTNFLRFPLRYRAYFLVRLAYGALDPATLVASLWLVGAFAGIGVARPLDLPWAALVLGAFAVFNLLLNRAVFAWIERWLARRKSREILAIVFFALIISVQFSGPLVARFGHHAPRALSTYARLVVPAERLLPPGLAGMALARSIEGHEALAVGAFFVLCAYAAACLWILDLRLRAQFRGETISEAPAPVGSRDQREPARLGWHLPGFSGSVAAVFEKEFRYLSRSGPMLFSLAMPFVVLFLFRLDRAARARRVSPALGRHPVSFSLATYGFPIGVAYALLILTNLIYNCLGADGGGVQMYFVVPVRFRDVLLGKNLIHGAIIAMETALLWVAARLMFGPVPVGVVCATLAALLFAAAVNFAIGDCLSLLSPKKIDFGMLGRQRASGTTVLAGLVAQAIVFGLVALSFVVAHHTGEYWTAVVINLGLAAVALAGYAFFLGRIDNLARAQRETILSALLRA